MNYALCIKKYLKEHGFEALRPKAVLFDMDGVLYDSMPNHAVAWQESMRMFGIAMTRDDAYATEGQRGIDTIRQMVLQQQGRTISETEAQMMYDRKSFLFHLMPEAPIMPGAQELMEKIRHDGLSIGVVTGSGQRPLIARLLRDFGTWVDESHIVTAYDVSQGKPHPDPYLKGLEMAGGLQPWEAIVVENAPLGVQASVAARIFTVCINTGHLPKSVFYRQGTNLLLDGMPTLSSSWKAILNEKLVISREERWDHHYEELMAYMKDNHQRPSKYAKSDFQLVNWIKYNRKLINRGELPAERLEKFKLFEAEAERLKRINQYAYKHKSEE